MPAVVGEPMEESPLRQPPSPLRHTLFCKQKRKAFADDDNTNPYAILLRHTGECHLVCGDGRPIIKTYKKETASI